MKVLLVGDLHLFDKELSTTKGFRENNTVMLERLYDYLKEHEEVCLCIFEGDIQHKTPSAKDSLYHVSRWKHWLHKIGDLMAERLPEIAVIPREGNEKNENHPMPSPLFTLKGNHDMASELRSSVDYTLFDDLLFEGILRNPKGIVYKDAGKRYYIQFNNYQEADAPVPEEILKEKDIKVVKLFHDAIDVPTQGTWVKLDKKAFNGSDVLQNTHLGIAGHIHDPLKPVVVETLNGKKSIFLQTGSMGRTSAADGNVRDHGYCTVLDTTDGLKVTEVKVPLIPSEDYFDWGAIMYNQQQRDALKNRKNFNVSLGDYERKSYDPKEDIKNMDITEDVKENCLNVLDNVEK